MSATMTVGPAKLDWLSASSASSEDVSAAWRFISFIVFFLTSLAPVDDSWPAVGVDVAATGTFMSLRLFCRHSLRFFTVRN